MPTNDPGLYGLILSGLAAVGAWVVGEGGRIAIASGAGGFARWLSNETRTIRDGVVSVAGGLISGTYLWPGILFLISLPPGIDPVAETPNNIAMAAFVAGAMGMSLVKIIIKMVEARAASAVGGKDGSE